MSLQYAPLSEIRPASFAAYPYPAHPAYPVYPLGIRTIGTTTPVYVPRPGYVMYGTAYPWWAGYPVWPGWRVPGGGAYASASSSSSTRITV